MSAGLGGNGLAAVTKVTWTKQERDIDTVQEIFGFLTNQLSNKQIRAMRGGLTTNMNECGNSVIASVGVDKKNGAAGFGLTILCHLFCMSVGQWRSTAGSQNCNEGNTANKSDSRTDTGSSTVGERAE